MPTIDKAEVRWYWMVNWWDGPLTGLAIYQERLHYFDMVEDKRQWNEENDELLVGRLFNLFHLTDEQIEQWKAKHKAFQELVGTHWDFDENGNRDPNGKVIHQSHADFMRFYQIQWPEMRPEPSAVIGVFSELESHSLNK